MSRADATTADPNADPGRLAPRDGCCWRRPVATARASTVRWSLSRRPWSSTALPSTCARRSCTTVTSWRRWRLAGARFVEELDEVPEGATVVFSAHGVAPTVHAEAAERGLKTIDATCPLVTKVHAEARRFADEGYRILLIGHEGHEEVVGTTGEAPEHITIVDGPEHAADVEIGPGEKVVVALPDHAVGGRDGRDRRARCAAAAAAGRPAERRHLLRHAEPPGCSEGDRARVRRARGRRLGQLVELGAARRGRARGRRAGRVPGRQRRRARPGLVRRCRRRSGVTSGASVPEVLVDGVLAWLAERGFGDVTRCTPAEERLMFALPPELRRDLKAAGQA